MVKKTVILCLLLIIMFAFSVKTAASVATIYIGGVAGGKETADDYTGRDEFYTLDFARTDINFTYIDRFRFSVDYGSGAAFDGAGSQAVENLELKFGYPVINGENTLAYFTASFDLTVREGTYKSTAWMLGGDFIYIITEHFFLEGDIQYSFLGATYKDYMTYTDYPLEQINLKLKAQFVFSRHISLMIAYHLTDFNVQSGLIIDDVFSPAIGLIYRF